MPFLRMTVWSKTGWLCEKNSKKCDYLNPFKIIKDGEKRLRTMKRMRNRNIVNGKQAFNLG